MKTTRQYLSGCTWCNARGFVKDITPDVTGTWNNICPICQGTKVMPVTETFEDEPEHRKAYMKTSNEYYNLNEKE